MRRSNVLFVEEGHRGHSIARTLMMAIEAGIVAEGHSLRAARNGYLSARGHRLVSVHGLPADRAFWRLPTRSPQSVSGKKRVVE